MWNQEERGNCKLLIGSPPFLLHCPLSLHCHFRRGISSSLSTASLTLLLLVLKEPCSLFSVFVSHDVTVLRAPTGQSRGYLVEIQLGRPSWQLCTSRFREIDRFQNTKRGRETRERERSRFDFHSFLPLPSYWLFYLLNSIGLNLNILFILPFYYFSSFYYVLAIRLYCANRRPRQFV